MNFLITLFVAFVIVGCATSKGLKKFNTEDYAPDCVKQFGPKYAGAVAKYESGDFSRKNNEARCFVKCLMEKAGFFDTEANFLPAVALEKLSVKEDKKKIESHINSCGHLKGKDGCDYAFKLYECYTKAHLAA